MDQETNEIMGLIRRYLDLLRHEGIAIEKAYLYGSHAKGGAHPHSDIDIALISSSFSDNRFKEGCRMAYLAVKVDSRIEPITFRPEDFREEHPLAYEIMKWGIEIPIPK